MKRSAVQQTRLTKDLRAVLFSGPNCWIKPQLRQEMYGNSFVLLPFSERTGVRLSPIFLSAVVKKRVLAKQRRSTCWGQWRCCRKVPVVSVALSKEWKLPNCSRTCLAQVPYSVLYHGTVLKDNAVLHFSLPHGCDALHIHHLFGAGCWWRQWCNCDRLRRFISGLELTKFENSVTVNEGREKSDFSLGKRKISFY